MTPPKPRKAQPIALEAGTTRRAAAHRALQEAHAHFLFNASGLTAASGPEFVHQARVGLRRLRVFVRLFQAELGGKRALRLETELSWLFGKLGRTRDLQVFASTVVPLLKLGPKPLAKLLANLDPERRAAEAALDAALASARFHALCRELASVEARLNTPAKQRGTRKWLARKLDRRRERILEAGRALSSGSAAALHDLRKQVKKLRYVSELAEALYAPKKQRLRRYQSDLKLLQETLGQLNDLAVARSLLPVLVPPPAKRKRLAAQLEQLRRDELERLPRSLERFQATKPIWK
ncbi:MAG TPA: CHAD domain-containing protein [Polyangiales bacterium]